MQLVHQRFQIERLINKFHLVGFDFREIQNIVQDREKEISALSNPPYVAKLLTIQSSRLNELCETQNGSQRRPDFMTHQREKFAPRHGGPFEIAQVTEPTGQGAAIAFQ